MISVPLLQRVLHKLQCCILKNVVLVLIVLSVSFIYHSSHFSFVAKFLWNITSFQSIFVKDCLLLSIQSMIDFVYTIRLYPKIFCLCVYPALSKMRLDIAALIVFDFMVRRWADI